MFGARKISYAGRLTLVKSVLTSLYSYWANIFLIPKGVLKKINSICHNYLWDGTSAYVSVPLVGWEQVCTPKAEGGLGLRYSLHWNIATMGKLVWWIYSKPDSLWVKWVHQIYLRGSSWPTHLPKAHMSSNWKAICRTRDLLTNGYINGVWLADQKGYNVKSGYEWIRPKEPKVGWAKLVWNNWALPKHCFLNWLILRNALNTKERLYKIGVSSDELFCICCADKETISHLFQHCRYVTEIMSMICLWLGIPLPQGNGLVWLGRRNWSPVQKTVCIAVFMCAYYAIWQQRNAARIEGVILRPALLISQCKTLMKIRLMSQLRRAKKLSDREWIQHILM
ncbi:uncharacterized protein LOC141631772 [Silene latifolia]|uniref:uncharacterized protein LOC141631772 n=1 Tax=Silene latifolia TaxID=37657 RepID=UPI003D76AC33